MLRTGGRLLGVKDYAFELPWTPGFLHKQDGLVLSIGQFNQWVGSQLMSSGLVQIWPGTPSQRTVVRQSHVCTGLRLADQGVDKQGAPADGYMPGMDVRARLTVVGDGPVGAVGQAIDERLGMPEGHARRDWAMGMKFVIELPPDERRHDRVDGVSNPLPFSPARSGTHSDIPNRRSSASSMCIRTGWSRWASLCRRGWAIRRAPRIGICSTSFSIPRCGAT